MKDKDFDDIGKRLYDLEADPPKDGWDKIAPVLNSPQYPGKVMWLRKNWWKPLILLIPVSFYLMYSGKDGKDLELASSVSTHSPVQDTKHQKPENTQGREASRDASSLNPKIEKPGEENELKENELTNLVNEGESARSESISPQKENDHSSDRTVTANTEAFAARENTGKEKRDQPRGELQKPVMAVLRDDRSSSVDHSASDDVDHTTPLNKREFNSVETTLPPAREQNLVVVPESTPEKVSTTGERTSDGQVIAQTGMSRTPEVEMRDEQIPGVEVPQQYSSISNASGDAIDKLDTLQAPVVLEAMALDTASSSTREEEEKQKKQPGTWRVTALFAPQFSTHPAKPVSNDEILVTEIENSNDMKRTGFGFALGVGKALTPQFYLDGQLSFMQAKQNTHFSYATGEVDTLLAVQQPDQSVLVTPVYHVSNREISTRYSYAGVRLGGTYYFWSTARRRFNLTATVGLQYLVSADVRENVNGQWVALSNTGLDKINYTVMLGAGYSFNLTRGWEVMISPALAYSLGNATTTELPYTLNQQSFNLNVMLSKTLGRR